MFHHQTFCLSQPVWPIDWVDVHLGDVKSFDKFFVHGLCACETCVLFKDARVAPSLKSTEDTDQATDPVLSLVAMDQHGVVAAVEHLGECCHDLIVFHGRKGFFVDGDAVMENIDTFLLCKSGDTRPVVLVGQIHDAAQAHLSQKGIVALIGVAAARDTYCDGLKIERWHQQGARHSRLVIMASSDHRRVGWLKRSTGSIWRAHARVVVIGDFG